MVGRATFTKGAKLERIEKKLDGPAIALKQIGALMVAESQASFKAQEFGGERWRERAEINVFGIIADFHSGKASPPKRRFQSSPALRDTGALAKSIAFVVKGDTVEVGTNLHYAAVHLTGGEVESKPITGKVRRLLWKWLKKQNTELKRRLGWLLNSKFRDKTLKTEVPARKFVGVTPKTIKTVGKIVGVSIMEVEN